MKKLLIIDHEQYGYHTDVFKYCQHLKGYDITVICYDWKLDKVDTKDIHIVYVKKSTSSHLSLLFMLFVCYYHLLKNYQFVFVCFFPHCELLTKLSLKKMHLDIRTLGIGDNEYWRKDWDNKVNNAIPFFDSVSTISRGVAEKLNLNSYFYLPLGADIISNQDKVFENINLLYIGTFSFRNIHETIEGLGIFLKRHKFKIRISYDIIGYGKKSDIEELEKAINENQLKDFVFLRGRKKYCELKEFLDSDNIGVSYIPITEHYNNQPPTKTFEYILSGLYCIATGTQSNKEVINDVNGMIIRDSKEDFANALELIYEKKKNFNSQNIRKTLLDYQWENIVKMYLLPILNN